MNQTKNKSPKIQLLLFSSFAIPKEIKAPRSTGELPSIKMIDLASAKEKLVTSIEELNSFFQNNPKAKTVHPCFGELNHNEWLLFHHKHFAHPLGQFGIKFD